MVQSLNFNAIFGIFNVLRKPQLAVPHIIVDDIRDIKFELLKKKGIKALAFDKDNTLTAPYENEIYPPFNNAWQECKKQFGSENIIIISNSAGTADDPDFQQAKKTEDNLGVPVLRHKSKKPDGGSELISHFAHYPPEKIVVIGDRLLTDVVFGNLNGMATIFTKRIVSEQGDNKIASIVRQIEYRLLVVLQTCGIKPPRHSLLSD
ncbi:HAD-superfamily phosphatase [Gigaspora margarita]|uniref:HAD-superfamily phosphatase n=1 Tax=Gigaspora margarita TaxID=4874 RepID=A0A8H3X193_GIGMA|nr:HAD-superfamily phosphatase [Gigaspora margarita]